MSYLGPVLPPQNKIFLQWKLTLFSCSSLLTAARLLSRSSGKECLDTRASRGADEEELEAEQLSWAEGEASTGLRELPPPLLLLLTPLLPAEDEEAMTEKNPEVRRNPTFVLILLFFEAAY